MSVIPLTLTISLCLVFTFVVFFLREQSRRRFGSAESEALLPLAEEAPHVDQGTSGQITVDLRNRASACRRGGCGDHGHEDRTPCDGCKRRSAVQHA